MIKHILKIFGKGIVATTIICSIIWLLTKIAILYPIVMIGFIFVLVVFIVGYVVEYM